MDKIARVRQEIERRIALYSLLSEDTVNPNRIDEDRQLLDFINTLRESEVDLEKEIIKVCEANNWFEPEDSCEWEFAKAIAHHFYELGKNSK